VAVTETNPTSRQSSSSRHYQAVIALIAVSGLLAVAVFIRMTSPGVSSDILIHAQIAKDEWRAGWFYSYTLWSPLLFVASMGGHLISLRIASIALLSLAVVLKVLIARRLAEKWGASPVRAVALAGAVLVATPILALHHPVLHAPQYSSTMFGAIYLGRFSAVVWHNSTMIACAPLVLLAADAARRAYESPELRRLTFFGAMLALSALMKPNYAMAALPVLLPVLLWRVHRTHAPSVGELAKSGMAIAGPTVAVLLIQRVLVRDASYLPPLTFTVDPFAVWRYYAQSPALALLQSLAFPLVATVAAFLLQPRTHAWLTISWAVTGVGICELILLGERNRVTGLPVLAGNWFWGPHLAVLVLFLASGTALASAQRSAPWVESQGSTRSIRRFGPMFAWVILAAHVCTGVLYVWRLFVYDAGFAT
jgi:hypothetical protein